MMLDTWDNKIFYPRFYDCDTICSYDNSGQLKFDVDIEMEQGYWNTSSSRLWTRIRDLFHDELIEVYNKMRQNGLSYESLMKYFYDEQIAKIPQTYYNKDYDVKYAPFADSYIGMANGDTYEHLKRWLSQRLRFVDTLFDYAPSYNNDVLTIRANTTELMRLEIETYTPVYQHLSWYNNQMDKKKIDGKISVEFTGKAMAETDQEVLIYGGSNIKSIKGITSMNPNRMLIGSATKLMELEAPNCPLLADINANKSNLAPHSYLTKVDLSNCPLLGGNLIINNSSLIKEIDITGTGITGLNLPSSLRNLESLKLPKAITSLNLNNAVSLHTLQFDEPANLSSINLSNCNKLTNVVNFNLSETPNIALDNSLNTFAELYFKNTNNLTIRNMSNLERIIYTPNSEHEEFDKANIDNAPDYMISTLNCPKLSTFMTTAPYRDSYNKEYGEVKPNEVFISNKLDLSNTQFTDIKLLSTTDTNELILPKTTKNIIVDSAYDLDTYHLTDGNFDTIHIDLKECYETDYKGQVLLNGETPNIVPSASDGSLIYSMHTSDKQAEVYIWDLDGLALDVFHIFGLNNDVKIVGNTLSMPNRADDYSKSIKNLDIDGIIAIYTASDDSTFPTFNEGYRCTNIVSKKENIYEYILIGEDKDILPTSINFNNKSNLLTVEYLGTSNITTMNSMFYGCSSLTSIDLSGWDTSSVTDMSNMFYNCTSLTSLDISDWNTSQVTDMNSMFYGCNKLQSLDVSKWTTSSVTKMNSMFYGCTNLQSLDLSNWDISSVTNMTRMFENCTNLQTLDITNWTNLLTQDAINSLPAGNGTNELMAIMSLTVPTGWTLIYNNPYDIAIYTCNKSGVLPTFNTGYTGYSVEETDNGDGTYKTYIRTNDLEVMPTKYSFSNKTALLSIEKLKVTSAITSMDYMFNNCWNLPSIEGIENWDTSSVTNMGGMFSNCKNLTSLDLSGWDTSSVTNMSEMFYNCQNLTSLNLSGWDTSSVTNMASMFQNSSKLTSIEGIENWDTSSVTAMNAMLNSTKLTSLDLSGWVTSKVTNMAGVFKNCTSLTSLDLSGWVTSKVTNIASMFDCCSKLTSLNVSGWDTSSVTNMNSMFNICTSLTSLDVSGWVTSKVTDMKHMFYACNALTNIEGIGEWDTSSVTTMNAMFYQCNSLTSLNVSGWDTSKVTNMGSMFNNCNNLTSLDSMMNISADLTLSGTKLDVSSLLDVIDNLAILTATKTLTLGTTLLAKLTAEQIAVATNKGWTVV